MPPVPPAVKMQAYPRPLWRGPKVDGITYSMMSRFLTCRERFRLLVVEGLRGQRGFDHKIEYGQMWHACEEAFARDDGRTWGDKTNTWELALLGYCRKLSWLYPTQQPQIKKWYSVCLTQFPVYVAYWSKQPDVQARTPVFQEQVFDLPYKTYTGQMVRLRGKWDSVDVIGDGRLAAVYVQENKTKGDVRPEQLRRQLTYDLQSMMYCAAFDCFASLDPERGGEGYGGRDWDEQPEATAWCNLVDRYNKPLHLPDVPLGGVRYNVVRRPLSGGEHSIKQRQPTKAHPRGETDEEFYGRLGEVIADHPQDFFARWTVEVNPHDLDSFKRGCLDPLLDQLCQWWDWVSSPEGLQDPFRNPIHWRHPFGVRNVLDEGGYSDVDEYLLTGNTIGLERASLFGELQPEEK